MVFRALAWVQNEPRQVVSDSEELTDGLKTQVLFAREYLKDVNISEKQVERLVMEAARGACQGHRSELFAARVAKASAALDVSCLSLYSCQHHAEASNAFRCSCLRFLRGAKASMALDVRQLLHDHASVMLS